MAPARLLLPLPPSEGKAPGGTGAWAPDSALLAGPPALPAARRYTGVVWEHMGIGSLPAAARRRAARSVLVLSGLLGVVAAGDPVPDYRCKAGAHLPALGTLNRWWRPAIAEALAPVIAGAHVVDLLPNEHAAALTGVDRGQARSWRRVHFEHRDRPGVAAGHDAKATKGRLARHLLLGGNLEDAPPDALVPRYD